MKKRASAEMPGMLVSAKTLQSVLDAIDEGLMLPTAWPDLVAKIKQLAAEISASTSDPTRKRLARRVRQYLEQAEVLVSQKNHNVPYACFMLGMQFSRLQLLAFDEHVKESQYANVRRKHANSSQSENAKRNHKRILNEFGPQYLRLAKSGMMSHTAICAQLAKTYTGASQRLLIDIMKPLMKPKVKKKKR